MCLKTHSQACGSIFSTIGVHTNTDAFSDPGCPKGGRITVGVQPQEGERESWAFWKDFKISILVILYGSGCFDPAAAEVWVCEREIH